MLHKNSSKIIFMIKISKLTDYATVIMSHLATVEHDLMSAALIAKRSHISLATVSKILKILAKANLVFSQRGSGGGYRISRNPSQIHLAHIVAALEGHLALTECCELTTRCQIDASCGLKHNWQIINKMIYATLANINLATMMQPMRWDHAHLQNGKEG